MRINSELKGEADNLINGQNDFGTSSNVIKLSHYNYSQDEIAKLKEQEGEILRL